jgi:hypothetical protein
MYADLKEKHCSLAEKERLIRQAVFLRGIDRKPRQTCCVRRARFFRGRRRTVTGRAAGT